MVVRSHALLAGGVIAASLFVVLWAAHAVTRDGFRLTYHPMSLLSLGDWGCVQVANFIVVGLLVVGGGIGLGRRLGPGRLVRWIRGFIVLIGVGLVVSGLFATDAGAGFPAGAPDGAPVRSWHGAIHEAGFIVTQIAFLGAACTLAVRFAKKRRIAWAIACAAAAIAAILVAAMGDPQALAIRLVVSSAIELGLISAVMLESLVGRAEPHPDAEETAVGAEPPASTRPPRAPAP
jgi:hypothetical protein